MTETKDYLDLAVQELARRRAAADEAELHSLANAMRESDEVAARHAALRAKHGLHPAATPREISDAWIAHHKAFGSFVVSRYSGGGPYSIASEILAPEGIEDEKRRAEMQALQTKLRKEFEAQYDASVAGRTVPVTRAA